MHMQVLTKKPINIERNLIKTYIVYGFPLIRCMDDPVNFHEISRKIVSQVSFYSINLSLVYSGLVVKGSWEIQGNNSDPKIPWAIQGYLLRAFGQFREIICMFSGSPFVILKDHC